MTSQLFTKSAASAPRGGIAQGRTDHSPVLTERHGAGTDVSGRVVIASEWSTDPCAARISERGFSLAELALNMAIIMILAAMSVPAVTKTIQTFRIQADARRIYSLMTLARMRAAADFTKGELSSNLSAGTFQLMLYSTSTSSYVNEGGTQNLSSGNSFSYGSISTPAGSQSPIAQSFAIIFNSRGIPVDPGGTPTGDYALYLSNGTGLYYAVTVSVTGTIKLWVYSGSAWVKNI